MKTLLLFLFILPLQLFGQESKKNTIQQLDSTINAFLPTNWVCVSTDSSVHIYFAFDALNSSQFEKNENQYIDDSTLYGKSFLYQPKPDSVFTEYFNRGVQGWDGKKRSARKKRKEKIKNYKTNNILKIDICVKKKSSLSHNLFGYTFEIESTMEKYNRIIFRDANYSKHPFYYDELGSSLNTEYNWLYLSLRLLIGKHPTNR